MITATKGGDEDEDKIILCANPAVDYGQDFEMLARDKMMHGGGGVSQEGVVGQDGKNGGYGEVMGLAYGSCGGVGVGGPMAGQRSNGSNAPHSISKGICAIETLVRTKKEGELMDISPLAFVAVPTVPPSFQGQNTKYPHFISKGGSAAKISHSIFEGGIRCQDFGDGEDR
jgi:hypothetical protein